MPVRSLGSSILRWPDRDAVHEAARRWAEDLARHRPEVLRVGYFGSYARGDWGVGSDLDLVMVVESSPHPFPRRAAAYDATSLPVPCDLLAYTEDEWDRLPASAPPRRETVWVFERRHESRTSVDVELE